jgi:hypothetical protein
LTWWVALPICPSGENSFGFPFPHLKIASLCGCAYLATAGEIH